MIRLTVFFFVSLSVFATDRYVSPLGTNTGGCTSIGSPCLTIQYAADQSSAGDTVYLRGGTYTSAVTSFLAPTKTATAAAPILIRCYQGEYCRVDGQNAARRFLLTTPSNTYGSHFQFAGIHWVNWNWNGAFMLSQGNHPGIVIKGSRVETEGFTIKFDQMTDGSGVKLLGSQFLHGFGITCTIDDAGADDDYVGVCPEGTTHLLLNTQTANTGACTLDIGDGNGPKAIKYNTVPDDPTNGWFAGSGHGRRLAWWAAGGYWLTVGNTTFECAEYGGTANADYHGCDDIIVQDSIFDRKGAASDYFAAAGTGGSTADGNGLIERVSVRSSTVINDCIDWKYSGLTVNWLEAFGCRAKGLVAWGYTKWRHFRTDSYSTGVGGQISGAISAASDDGGFIKLTRNSNVGQGPFPGLVINVSGVNGCTGANGTFTIKDAVTTYIFRIQNTDGSGTTCGGTFSSSPSSSISMRAPLTGYGADLQYVTTSLNSTSPYLWAVDTTNIPIRAFNNIMETVGGSTGDGFRVGYTSTLTTGNNQFYHFQGQAYSLSYRGRHDGLSLATYEPDSNHGAANLAAYDATTFRAFDGTFRATATSPSTLANRGFFAGTNTTESGDDSMVVRWRAVTAADFCTVYLDDASDFLTPLATVTSDPGHQWREAIFGSLSASTLYYHKITCGATVGGQYDVFTGSGTTLATVSGTQAISQQLAADPNASATKAALDYWDGAQWVAGTATTCSSGCTVSTAAINSGAAYLTRFRRISAGDATLTTSGTRAVVNR